MGQWESTMAFGENPLVAELKQVVTVLQKSIFKYETYVYFPFRLKLVHVCTSKTCMRPVVTSTCPAMSQGSWKVLWQNIFAHAWKALNRPNTKKSKINWLFNDRHHFSPAKPGKNNQQQGSSVDFRWNCDQCCPFANTTGSILEAFFFPSTGRYRGRVPDWQTSIKSEASVWSYLLCKFPLLSIVLKEGRLACDKLMLQSRVF